MGSHLLVLIASLASGFSAAEKQLPTVEFRDCEELNVEGYDSCMAITFHDVGREDQDDVIVLNRVEEDPDNLEGELLSDPESRVSVTIEKGVASIAISTDEFLLEFTYNLESKVVGSEELPSGFNLTFPSPVVPPGMTPEDDNALRADQLRPLPRGGFHLSVYILYDLAFQSKFGSRTKKKVFAVMNHVKTLYRHHTLGATMKVDLAGIRPIYQKWRASGESLGQLREYVESKNLPQANAYAVLSYENDAAGVVGLAYMSTICSDKKWRLSLSEYLYDDLRAASIVAHEIGHNLGMKHDFKSDGGKRYASDGSLCTGINGIMDYGSNPNRWSRCSEEYLQKTYAKNQPFCLKPADPDRECKDKTSACRQVVSYCHKDSFKGKLVTQYCKKTCGLCE